MLKRASLAHCVYFITASLWLHQHLLPLSPAALWQWLARQTGATQPTHSQSGPHLWDGIPPTKSWGLPWGWPIAHSKRSSEAKEFIEVHMGDACGEITPTTPPLCFCTHCLSLSFPALSCTVKAWPEPPRDLFSFYKAFCYGNCV